MVVTPVGNPELSAEQNPYGHKTISKVARRATFFGYPEPLQPHEYSKLARRANFFGYNVWGFKDESWRKLILPADPNRSASSI